TFFSPPGDNVLMSATLLRDPPATPITRWRLPEPSSPAIHANRQCTAYRRPSCATGTAIDTSPDVQPMPRGQLNASSTPFPRPSAPLPRRPGRHDRQPNGRDGESLAAV